MNAETEIDLTELHAAIAADIQAHFPALKTVQFYREEDDRTPLQAADLPACILQLTDMEASDLDRDPGTSQLAVDARFEARVVLGFKTPNAKVAVRLLAASLAAFVHKRRWVDPSDPAKKLPTAGCEVVGLFPDEFDDKLDQFEVWRVEWVSRLHLGQSIWTDEGTTPGQPLYSWLPYIGNAHEDEYREVLPPL